MGSAARSTLCGGPIAIGLAVTFALTACHEGLAPFVPPPDSTVLVLAIAGPATVTAAQIALDDSLGIPRTTLTLATPDGLALTRLVVPDGERRTLHLRARDASGTVTHTLDTTLRVVRGVRTAMQLAVAGAATAPVVLSLGPGDRTVRLAPADSATMPLDTLPLAADVLGPAGQPVSGAPLTWISSDTSVAIVDTLGRVLGRAPGMAVVTALSEGGTASRHVRVADVESLVVALAGPATVASAQITLKDSAGANHGTFAVTATDGIARVRLGAPVGLARILQVRARDAGGSVSHALDTTLLALPGTRTVIQARVASASTAPLLVSVGRADRTVQLASGDTDLVDAQVLPISVTILGPGGPVTGASAWWVSSDPTVATVDSLGRVTAHASGTALITALHEASTASRHVLVAAAVSVTAAIAGPPQVARIRTRIVSQGGTTVTDTTTSGPWAIVHAIAAAGRSYRILVSSTDAAGAATHQADTAFTPRTGGTPDLLAADIPSSAGLVPLVVSVGRAGTRLVLTPGDSGLYPGDTILLRPYAVLATGDSAAASGVRWLTSDSTVATIDAAGLLRVRSPGHILLSAVYAGALTLRNVFVTAFVPVTPRLQTVTAGRDFSCGTRAGTQCWGGNDSGQLGQGTRLPSPVPLAIFRVTSYASVSAGFQHVCGLLGGTISCWGDNSSGQLGIGSRTTQPVPLGINAGGSFVAVSAGRQHTCALASDGSAWCWGDNTYGQLGNGTTSSATSPVQVAATVSFRAIAAGGGHTCALEANGNAWCWGQNFFGQLANSAAGGQSSIPVRAGAGLRFASITAGSSHTCGVTGHGLGYCWGDISYGKLGTSNLPGPGIPAAVDGGILWQSMAAGGNHTCGIALDGSAYCWGLNRFAALGDGTDVDYARPTPMPVAGARQFTQLAAGSYHTCGKGTDGNIWCWGMNATGQLGDGAGGSALPVAAPVSGGHSFAQVAVGRASACGLTAAGAAWCWGNNSDGQLGDGSTNEAAAPVPVAGGLAFAQIDVGSSHACGITGSGAAWCWGLNAAGQLGDSTGNDARTPVAVAGGHHFTQVVAGGTFSCALEGTAAYCWGSNAWGNLGIGTTGARYVPTPVAGGLSVRALVAGDTHACLITTSGAGYCWGGEQPGIIRSGPPGFNYGTVPAAILPGITLNGVSAGSAHTCAMAWDGTGFCWGRDDFGRLGLGGAGGYFVAGGHVFSVLSVGINNSCGVSAGTAYCWGYNGYGEFTYTTIGTASAPVAVSGISGLIGVDAGGSSACGWDGTGAAYCWGANEDGQLGRGTRSTAPVPVRVF